MGILLHALMPFLPDEAWMVSDANPSAVAEPVVFVIHLFRMTLFMLLAGYFGAMVLRRRGARRYLGDRAKRILLPAIVFWPVALIPLGLIAELNSHLRGTPAPVPPSGADPLMMLTPGVLWFLWTLLESLLIVVVVRAVLLRLLGEDRLARAGAAVGGWLSSPAGVLLASLPYAAGLLIQNSHSGGIQAPLTFLPELGSLVPYLGAFTTGWLLFAHREGLDRLPRTWVAHLAVALVLTPLAYLAKESSAPVPVTAALVAVASWCWVFALIGGCVRHLHRERPMLRYLADSSYWAYLLHLPLLLLCEVLIADLAWPMPVKLALTLGVTGTVLLSSYHFLVRPTALGGWLNGRKHPRRSRRAASPGRPG